jgi:glutamyl-tRNA reductase
MTISHLFRVGTGLDSQILGDFEIMPKLNPVFTVKVGLNAYGTIGVSSKPVGYR